MPKQLVEYLEAANRVFEALSSHSGVVTHLRQDGRAGGGFFCLATPLGQPRLIGEIGEPNPAKLSKYLRLTQEKAGRLAAHPEHRLSRSSRNPGLDEWGGAVRGTEHLFSFSGLPEDLDEILSLLTALQTGELSFADAVLLADDGNDFKQVIPPIVGFLKRRGTRTGV